MTKSEEEFVVGILKQVVDMMDEQKAYFEDSKKGKRGTASEHFLPSMEKEKAMYARAKKGILYYTAKWKLEPFGAK